MNTFAQNLGRLGRGKKKTLTKAAIDQRRKAAKISAKKRTGQARKRKREKNTPTAIMKAAYAKLPKLPLETPGPETVEAVPENIPPPTEAAQTNNESAPVENQDFEKMRAFLT